MHLLKSKDKKDQVNVMEMLIVISSSVTNLLLDQNKKAEILNLPLCLPKTPFQVLFLPFFSSSSAQKSQGETNIIVQM